ncbi:hypothetical protein CGRA01v4_08561 [Colletotrichum graminicola]|uniref:Uncharacterized protein n=1 Tax=Colletotrichum graminicola (strain M1.001 / M2 / FGSC 10212) TaxID=645133 RepID=E3QJG4_COLGM|nr:uncharacterized protein GLRG_06146 [Colletotrichum graminicola M1.001]EFQ31002.1 hypothetical protein GLRG_06146 [Colletotrichum graminicola M1.001]WDK17278.1 hypothetical protein CGRA01v4_08561 [Colletotrichum graminicola]
MSSQTSSSREPTLGHIDRTSYAGAYQSRFTEEIVHPDGSGSSGDMHLLRHVNCGYLSTHGHAPTLLALKQHAQALTVLIGKLAPTTRYGEMDNGNNPRGRTRKTFRDNEAFDWLNDLSHTYQNDDEWHHKPLTDLMNQIQHQSDTQGVVHHCPLQSFANNKEKRTKPRPYASHGALALHANECLEILDHEYSATGGLMSLLPTDADTDAEEMRAVRNSLLGQWLLFNQHLVARVHELELSYANALDVMAGEAVVPMQMVSKTGPDATSGRELAFPQDRWVLANAGDEVFDHLSRALDREEAQIEHKRAIWAANGTYGERMWEERRGGDLYARGLVFYDVKTRFYRLQGKGRSSIFILPAHGVHPAVRQTRKLEVTPRVVTVVAPAWPARVSEWESKFKDQLDEATRVGIQNHRLEALTQTMKEQNTTLATSLHKEQMTNAQFEMYYGTSESADGPRRLEKAVAFLETRLKEQTEALDALEAGVAEGLKKVPAMYHTLFPAPLRPPAIEEVAGRNRQASAGGPSADVMD